MKKINPKIDKHYLEGSGGGKGGSSRTPTEAPNTLQSSATYKILEALSEGEIAGVVGGLKGVFLDDTPIQNQDNTFNFEGVDFDTREGLPNQEYIPGFDSSESIVGVNVEVEDETPVVRTVLGGNIIDACRVVIRLPAGLSQLDEKTGDLNGWRVGVAIDVRPNTSAAWQNAITRTIVGKTMRPWEEAFRVSRPANSTNWQIRVRRTTQTEDSAGIADRLDWFLYTQIIEEKVTYPDVAHVGVKFSAQSTGGAVPTRSYLVDGLKIRVPTNYQPAQYNSDNELIELPSFTDPQSWNGTFKEEVCNDPALICLDMLTNERYGLGEWVEENEIDIYSFYDAAVYNTEKVDAFTEQADVPPYPSRFISRFMFDGTIATREDAFQALQQVAASCRGSIIVQNGTIKFIQDRPAQIVTTINREKTVDGEINYSYTDINNRFTSVNVVYNERNNRYLPTIVNERWTQDCISRYGFNEVEVNLLGCTNEWQARRMARWALYSSLFEVERVDFNVSYEHSFLQVNDIIRIADNDKANIQFAGMVADFEIDSQEPATVEITLDRDIENLFGQFFNSDLIMYTNTGQVIRGSISSWIGLDQEGRTQIRINIFDGPLQTDYKYITFAFSSPVQPKPFRIDSIREIEEGVWGIAATEHNPSKYDFIDFGIELDTPIFDVGNPGYTMPRPSGLQIDVESIITPSSTIRFRIRMNWNDIDEEFFDHFRVKYRRNNGQWTLSDRILQSEYLIDDALPAFYEFEIFAVSSRNIYSPPLRGSQLVDIDGQASPLNPPSNLELLGGGTQFNAPTFTCTWNGPAPAPAQGATVKDFIVRLYDSNDNIAKLFVAEIDEGSEDPFTGRQTISNTDVLIANQTFIPRANKVSVVARDNLNRLTAAVENTFTNPAPAAVTITDTEALLGAYKVTHTGAIEDDVEGYKIIHSTSSPVPLSRASLQKDDQGLQHIVEGPQNETYFVRVAAYDSWSRHIPELNWSNEESVTTDFEFPEPTFDDPNDVLGLSMASRIIYLSSGAPRAEILISWNSLAGDDITYDLEISEAGQIYHTTVVPNPSQGGTVTYSINGIIGTEYCARVRSRRATAFGNWSVPQCITQAADATAPAVPTGLTLTALYQGALVQWANPNSANFDATEVWRRVGGSGNSELVARISRPSSIFFDDGLTIGTQYQYRIRSVSVEGVQSIYSSWLAVVPSNVPSGSIVAASIAASSITGDRLQANTITANQLSTGELITTSFQLGSGIITSAKIADTLQSDNFIAGTSGWRLQRNTGNLEANSILARGSLTVGNFTAGQFRTEISDIDPTYLIWSGTGTKNDNGIFWVKRNGTAKIDQNVFGITIPTFDTPPVPTGLSASGISVVLTGGSEVADITVTWNNVAGTFPGLTYDLQIIEGTGSNVISVITIPPPATGTPKYTFRGNIAQTYSFRVRSTNVNARSAWSSSINTFVGANTINAGVPGTPFVQALPAFGAMVSWTNPSSNLLAAVEVQRRRSNGTDVVTLGEVAAPTNIFSDQGPLTAGLAYQYRVRSRSINGTFSGYSAWSSAFTAATVPDGSIGSNQIVNNAITETKIANNSISTPKLQANSITSNEIAANTITAGNILAGSISGDRLVANTITSNQLSTGTLITTSGQIGNAVINSANIGNAQITSLKLAGNIQSDNWSASAGWQIRRDTGNATFNNLNARGSIVTGASPAQRVEITPSGSDNYLIWAGFSTKNDTNSQFWLKSDGSANFAGRVSAANLAGPIIESIPIIFSSSVINQSTTNWVTVGGQYMEIPATIERPRRPFIMAACPVFGTGTAGTSIGAWIRVQLIIQNSNGTWPTTWTTLSEYTQDSTSVGSAAPVATGSTNTGTRGFRVRIQFRAVVANQGTQTNGWTGLFQALPAGTGVIFVDDATGAPTGGGTPPASPNDPIFNPPPGGWVVIP